MADTLTITCPVCGAEFGAENDLQTGEIIECAECGAELEVIGLDADKGTASVELAPEEEEDWGE